MAVQRLRAPGATRRTAWCLVAVLLAVTTAACGDDGGSDDDAEDAAAEDATSEETGEPEVPEEVSMEDATAAYTSCMTDNGSDVADIPEGTSLESLAEMGDASPEVQTEMGIDATLIQAHAECWPIVEDAIAAGATVTEESSPSTTVDPVLAQQMHAAVSCLNDRGWDFLEPGVEAGAVEMAPRQSGFNWDDPTFLQDQRECQQDAGMMVP
jgi:hypothetical protein